MTKSEGIAGRWSGGWVGAIVDAWIVFIALSFATQHLSLPVWEGDMDVVSATSRSGFHPLTNYLRFLLAFAGTFASFSLSYWRGRSLLSFLWSGVKRLSESWGKPAGSWALCFLLLALVGVTAVNRTATDVTAILEDTFHEGEYIGNVPAISLGDPFERIFLIHGGMDLLPGWIADHFAPEGNRLAQMRLVTVALHGFAFLAAYVVLYLSARPQIPGRSRIEVAFLVLAAFLGVTTLLGYDGHSVAGPVAGNQQPFSVRDAAFLVQLALLFGFFHFARHSPSCRIPGFLSAATGMLLPLSFLYSYERALLSVLAAIILTPAILTQPRKVSRSWVIGLLTGSMVGATSLLLLVGTAGVHGILDQILYWGRTSRLISTIPFTVRSFPKEGFLLLGVSVMVQCWGIFSLVSEYRRRRSAQEYFEQHLWLITWVAVSIVFLRVVLERPDWNHLLSGAMPSYMLLGVLIVVWLNRTLERLNLLPWDSTRRGGWAGLGLIVLLLIPLSGSPIRAFRTMRSYWEGAAIPDYRILKADYLEAAEEVKAEVAASNSFFTMTSEGVWYYLFGVPSPSRFHQLFYARDSATQKELIESLETRKPAIILFGNSFWNNNRMDGVSVFNTNTPVVRYVLRSYEPYRSVHGNWFWRYSDVSKSFSSRSTGTLDTFPDRVERTRDAVYSGTIHPTASWGNIRAVFTSLGEDNVLVWAGMPPNLSESPARWEATVPTGILPVGNNIVRFWLLRGTSGVLHPLGEAILVSIPSR